MFDFEKLDVYSVVKEQNQKVLQFLKDHPELDPEIASELKKASMAVVSNLAEGTGKMNDTEKKQYLSDARTSVFRSVAMLDILRSIGQLDEEDFLQLYEGFEKSSKMLLGMYRSYSSNRSGNNNSHTNSGSQTA
jgi:four helix bundle protein